MKIIFLSLLVLSCHSCGTDFDSLYKNKLSIYLYGVNQAPDGATGNLSPDGWEFSNVSLTLTTEPESEATTEWELDALRMVGRWTQVGEVELTGAESMVATELSMTFDAAGAMIRNGESQDMTMTGTTFSQVFSQQLKPSASYELHIVGLWKNTLVGDNSSWSISGQPTLYAFFQEL